MLGIPKGQVTEDRKMIGPCEIKQSAVVLEYGLVQRAQTSVGCHGSAEETKAEVVAAKKEPSTRKGGMRFRSRAGYFWRYLLEWLL